MNHLQRVPGLYPTRPAIHPSSVLAAPEIKPSFPRRREASRRAATHQNSLDARLDWPNSMNWYTSLMPRRAVRWLVSVFLLTLILGLIGTAAVSSLYVIEWTSAAKPLTSQNVWGVSAGAFYRWHYPEPNHANTPGWRFEHHNNAFLWSPTYTATPDGRTWNAEVPLWVPLVLLMIALGIVWPRPVKP
jgi:hypothetical protein